MFETRTCRACGGSSRRDTRPDVIEYKGRSVEVEQPGWWCDTCDEVVLEPADIAVRSPAFAVLKAKP